MEKLNRRLYLKIFLAIAMAATAANLPIHRYYSNKKKEPESRLTTLEKVVNIGEATISDMPITSRGLIGCMGLVIDYGDSAFLGHVKQGKLYGQDAVEYAEERLKSEKRNIQNCDFALVYAIENDRHYDNLINDLRKNGVKTIFSIRYPPFEKGKQRDIIYSPRKNYVIEFSVGDIKQHNLIKHRGPGKERINTIDKNSLSHLLKH